MIPVVLPRAIVIWLLVRLLLGTIPLAVGAPFASMPPSPIGVVLLCGILGLVDVRVRGERILWGNLGVGPGALATAYAAPPIPAEILIALLLR